MSIVEDKRWVMSGSLKINKELIHQLLGDDASFDDLWNSSVYKTNIYDKYYFFIETNSAIDSFENLPFKGFGERGH